MTSAREKFAELLYLTQLFLLQEHSMNARIFADSETQEFFRLFVQKQKANTESVVISQPQIPQAEPSQQQIPQTERSQQQTRSQPLNVPAALNSSISAQLPKEKFSSVAVIDIKDGNSTLLKESLVNDLANVSKEKKIINLEFAGSYDPIDTSDIRKIMAEKMPHFAFSEDIPDDKEGVEKSKLWKYRQKTSKIVILSFDEAPKQQSFLFNICKALNSYGISAEVINAIKIEQKNGWEELLKSKELSLVIATGHGVYSLQGIVKHYRESAKQAKHFLQEIPLLLLSDLSFYLKESTLKPSLWKALNDFIGNLPS